MNFGGFLFLALFHFAAVVIPLVATATPVEDVIQFSRAQNLSQDRQWRKLLHFEKDFFRIEESQIDSRSFFFASNGKKDPDAELEATITAFFKPVEADTNEHAQCRFPARYSWLKKKLSDKNISWANVKCDRFLAFFDGMRGDSVSLVFSAII